MKKIMLSILAIALTVSAVSGTAYALFSDTVNVAGMTITSGNANLGIYDKTGEVYTPATDWSVKSALINKLGNFYPGKVDYTELWFKNESKSDIPLSLQVKINVLGGYSWNDDLAKKISVSISETGSSTDIPTSGWVSLDWLKTYSLTFGDLVKPSISKDYKLYKMFIKMDKGVDSNLASKILSGDLVFTATQN